MNENLKDYIEKHNKQNCYKENTDSNIVFKDKKSATLTIKNPKKQKIVKIKVDGCLICGTETQKCDWMAANPKNEKVILIELKSRSNLEEAAGQFLATVKKIGLKEKDCFCILVSKSDFPKRGNKRQEFLKNMDNYHLKNSKHYTKSKTIPLKNLFCPTKTS